MFSSLPRKSKPGRGGIPYDTEIGDGCEGGNENDDEEENRSGREGADGVNQKNEGTELKKIKIKKPHAGTPLELSGGPGGKGGRRKKTTVLHYKYKNALPKKNQGPKKKKTDYRTLSHSDLTCILRYAPHILLEDGMNKELKSLEGQGGGSLILV
ncbi:unnamed protein product [Tuber aestivum]|uniref:Uncharacterized protein n=1 Tax=Tuber aestivum TaxID=59557 RepID=A0A292PZG6_9PEZI|nr:unnamed protein product [Tuber aestivum]